MWDSIINDNQYKIHSNILGQHGANFSSGSELHQKSFGHFCLSGALLAQLIFGSGLPPYGHSTIYFYLLGTNYYACLYLFNEDCTQPEGY